MTVDEIRARWAGIDLDGMWDWDHKDLRRQVEHGVVDIDYLLEENERLRDALVGADWIIKKLAPHETMAIMVRGYKPSDEDIATGAKYRRLIDDALAPQPDNAIPTQSERNSDAIAAEKE